MERKRYQKQFNVLEKPSNKFGDSKLFENVTRPMTEWKVEQQTNLNLINFSSNVFQRTCPRWCLKVAENLKSNHQSLNLKKVFLRFLRTTDLYVFRLTWIALETFSWCHRTSFNSFVDKSSKLIRSGDNVMHLAVELTMTTFLTLKSHCYQKIQSRKLKNQNTNNLCFCSESRVGSDKFSKRKFFGWKIRF